MLGRTDEEPDAPAEGQPGKLLMKRQLDPDPGNSNCNIPRGKRKGKRGQEADQ